MHNCMNFISKFRVISFFENVNRYGASIFQNTLVKARLIRKCSLLSRSLISRDSIAANKSEFKYTNARFVRSTNNSKTTNSTQETTPIIPDDKPAEEGLFARFKKTYKQHGKIFIAVHVATSIIWAGSFVYIAYSGFDLVPILKWLNFSESTIEKVNKPGIGIAAAAYLMYKMASPLRYIVTMGGTQFVVRYMKQKGTMPQVPESNKIRSLIKEGKGKVNDSYRKQRRKKTGADKSDVQ